MFTLLLGAILGARGLSTLADPLEPGDGWVAVGVALTEERHGRMVAVLRAMDRQATRRSHLSGLVQFWLGVAMFTGGVLELFGMTPWWPW